VFAQAQREGSGRVEVDGSLVEVPIYLNAKRLLERAALLRLI
jgi:citrate lyase subunit beta/citryl-CoA lyase